MFHGFRVYNKKERVFLQYFVVRHGVTMKSFVSHISSLIPCDKVFEKATEYHHQLALPVLKFN